MGKKNNDHEHFYSFDVDDNLLYLIENSDSERDLGILLQSDLKWDNHISNIIHRANFTLGKLKNSFKKWDTRTFKLLFTSFVRPLLEYGSVAWCPYKKQDIKRLEKVQRRATKLVPSIRNKSYEDRLKSLGLTSLEDRRIRGDLIQFFKFQKNLNMIEWFHPIAQTPSSLASGPAGSTRSQDTLYRQVVKTCPARHNFFTNRVAPYWNALPAEVKNQSNVNDFKNNYDIYFKNKK